MDNKINLSQLADMLAQAGGMSKAASEQFVKNFFDIISQAVLTEGLVKVKGLGTFKLVQMEDRESVNVNSGQRFTIEGHQKISFIPDTELKDRINKPFAVFETVEITQEQADRLERMDEEQAGTEGNDKIIKTTDNMDNANEQEPKKAPKEPKKEVKEEEKKSGSVWIKIIIAILVIALIVVLLWPVIGNKLLKDADKQPVKESAPAPAAVQPAPEAKPEAQPAKKEPAKFTLTKADQDKALPRFTAADTVNYKITGTKATVTMVKGDMLTTISEKYYGTKKLWPYIAKYNGLTARAAKKLPVGYKIKVPELANK